MIIKKKKIKYCGAPLIPLFKKINKLKKIRYTTATAYRRRFTKSLGNEVISQRSNQETQGNSEGAGEMHSLDGRRFSQDSHNLDTPQIWVYGSMVKREK